ncbi:superoxide dismutase [bacterium]|nr:superoxide dismutase [bacterium]
MKILAIGKSDPKAPPERFKPFLKAEAKRVWELQQLDLIREVYFRQDIPDAVIVLETSSTIEARKILNTLPLVEEKLIDFDIIPLKAYPGFERLFAD